MQGTQITNFSDFKSFKKEDFKKLRQNDTYALMLFLLFMLGRLPEYRTLTALLDMTDHKTFLKICEFFGGQTITIPTIDDLNSAITVLQLYNLIDIDEVDYNVAIAQVNAGPQEIIGYNKLKLVLEEYGIIAKDDSK